MQHEESVGAEPTVTTPEAAGIHPRDTERRIFEAAIEVFARKGRDGARMQEIADAAGMNRALLHYYFRSKQQLYEDVFAHGFQQFVSSFGHSLEEGSFWHTLRVFVDRYIDYVHDHQDMARLMVNECISEGSLLGQYLAAAAESGAPTPGSRMEDRIEEAVAAGDIRPVDPKHTLLTILSACLFPFVALPTVEAMHPQAREDFKGFLEVRKQHVYELLRSSLAPERAATLLAEDEP